MCNDLKPIADFEAIVYKVVAKRPKGRRLYSIAMGFAYPTIKGNIPKIKVQHGIGNHFDSDILRNKGHRAYTEEMVGRTAGFVKRAEALDLMYDIGPIAGYDVLIKKAKLTIDLMKGEYAGHVIAGRHIEFLE